MQHLETSFLGHVDGKRWFTGRLKIKPSGSGDENGLTAEADKVLCQLVMFFYRLFLLDVQEMKFSSYQESSVICG